MITFFEFLYFFGSSVNKKRYFKTLRKLREFRWNEQNTFIHWNKKIIENRNKLLENRKRKQIIIKNSLHDIQKRTQIDLIKYILQYSKVAQFMWIFVTIIFISLSIWFVYIIWMRSYADPLFVTLYNQKVSTFNVSEQNFLASSHNYFFGFCCADACSINYILSCI